MPNRRVPPPETNHTSTEKTPRRVGVRTSRPCRCGSCRWRPWGSFRTSRRPRRRCPRCCGSSRRADRDPRSSGAGIALGWKLKGAGSLRASPHLFFTYIYIHIYIYIYCFFLGGYRQFVDLGSGCRNLGVFWAGVSWFLRFSFGFVEAHFGGLVCCS